MRRSLAAPAAVIAGLMLAGCTPQVMVKSFGETSTRAALPTCEGSATSEFGLGNAVRDSITSLASLPIRFSTGSGTVTDVGGRLTISIRLCGPGADADQTRDAASVVARSIAESDSLGANVDAVRVENPDSAVRIVAKPFDAARFGQGTPVAELRGQWHLDETGR